MITIIIPTLDAKRGERTGKMALATAGCGAELLVVAGPKRGFTKTVNDGLRQVDSGDVCILNDDIGGFQYGWLNALRKGLYSSPKYGLAGPTGKSATKPMCEGRPGMTGLQVVRQLPFWCVVIKREALTEIGLLDEGYIHYCSDNDWCARARKAGYACVWVRDVFLKHKVHGSGLIGKWKQQDQRRYQRKRR